MSDLSSSALLRFLDIASDQGMYNSNTVAGYRSAVTKILGALSDDETADVTQIDLDNAVRRFNNLNPGALTPESMRAYRSRLAKAISAFTNYQSNPMSFKPGAAQKENAKRELTAAKRSKTPKKGTKTPVASAQEQTHDLSTAVSRLTLTYPLREDFLVQIAIPRDLKTQEALRLGAFLKTLCADFVS